MNQQQLRDFANLRFTEDESSTLNPIDELDENPGRLSADGAEYEGDSFANHAQATQYTYDKSGQLEGNEGYEKEVIEQYLCDHPLKRERSKLKDCGLILWIQRAPTITGLKDGTLALCLYKDCHVDQSRHIQEGDIRIAFDEKTARGLEHDPRINAGYVHLKCLEAHIPYHRQMFANLNFKVEGRGPQRKDPWLTNPTIFTTISQIVYAEDYIENCRNSGGSRGTCDAILLSAGIERELRGTHRAALEVQRKLLEMKGWGDLKAHIDSKYAQACSTELAGKNIPRRHKKRDSSSEEAEPNMTSEPRPLKRGKGKIKSNAFVKDGKMVWGKFEDPWSPLVSDFEDNTKDNVESRGDEDSGDNEATRDDDNGDLGDNEGSGDNEASRDDDNVDLGDNEASSNDENEDPGENGASSDDDGDEELGRNGASSSDDEPKGRKRMRSENEGDSKNDELRGDKRKRAY